MPETPTPFIRQLVASLARRTPGLDGVPPTVHTERLREQDRPDIEEMLDRALTTMPPPTPLTTEQVRTMALRALPAITATAATEYAAYIDARDADSTPAPNVTDSETEERPGSLAILAVLVPILGGATATIFLLVGYGLRLANVRRDFAHALTTTGWFFLAITALAILAGAVGLLRAALQEAAPSVAAANAVWREALLERGIEPFLHEVYQAQTPVGTTVPVATSPDHSTQFLDSESASPGHPASTDARPQGEPPA